MALFGGVYVTCMIGLLPDKTKDTYERFFAMVSAYLETNDLPNNFEGHFFMTDFEKNIRSSFQLFWPSVRTLGCYFHFSQVNITIILWLNYNEVTIKVLAVSVIFVVNMRIMI